MIIYELSIIDQSLYLFAVGNVDNRVGQTDWSAPHIFILSDWRLLELGPALDGDGAGGEAAEGVDERFGKASIGEQGDVEIYSGTADLVSVGELTGGEVLRQVHHHVDLLLVEQVECLSPLLNLEGNDEYVSINGGVFLQHFPSYTDTLREVLQT